QFFWGQLSRPSLRGRELFSLFHVILHLYVYRSRACEPGIADDCILTGDICRSDGSSENLRTLLHSKSSQTPGATYSQRPLRNPEMRIPVTLTWVGQSRGIHRQNRGDHGFSPP